MPPILYTVSLEFIESHLRDQYDSELRNLYMADTSSLLNGNVRLQDAITDIIDRYLESKALLSWGANISVTVTAGGNRLLYPGSFEEKKSNLIPTDPMKIAAENYSLMNEGLAIKVDLKIGHNTLLANTILAFFILISVLVLYIHYRIGSRKALAAELETSRQIDRLLKLEKKHKEKLGTLDQEKENLSSELAFLKEKLQIEKSRASQNEEELIEDVVALENKILSNLEMQKEQQREIDILKEKIKGYEKGKKRKASSGTVKKRFKTLYKNLSVHERAVKDFMDLTEDLKIKCEEVIHQLNEDPRLVNVKRKVFGKKNRETVLEVIFAYKGRLYFRNTPGKKIEILAVGTKNTQAKQLEFLDGL